MTILNIAEKPSVAKSISRMLSTTCSTSKGCHKYCPNITFDYNLNGSSEKMIFTSVLGHLFELQFLEQGKWDETDPRDLFDARVKKNVISDNLQIITNIKRQCARATTVVVWTDCDREGENIAMEIKQVIESVKDIQVCRARFSAISRNEIEEALADLQEINYNESDAVDARMELDLRIGSAFTRLQTIKYNKSNVLSFGPCQIPTLNFIVQRHKKIEQFVPENFYSLQNEITSLRNKEIKNTFKWQRGNIFDKNCVIHFFNILSNGKATIKSKKSSPKDKYKPLPLRTVEFQKTCSSYYKIDSHRLMTIAEKLYNSGYISYPRTETDSFPKSFGYTGIINKLKKDSKLGEYATNFTFKHPRTGKNNDQAHSPIYPLKEGSELQGDERKVYEFVARRFLGCISENAKGIEVEYQMEIKSSYMDIVEVFVCKGLQILERNYLDVYIYDKWESTAIGEFAVNEVVENKLEITEGATSKPEHLTEAELISLMDKNGIGTDATIHEHIHKIQTRGYAKKDKFKFIPLTLGINLIDAYTTIELPINEPTLRKNLEINLKKVCDNLKNKNALVSEAIQEYKQVYDKLAGNIQTFVEIMNRKGDDPSFGNERIIDQTELKSNKKSTKQQLNNNKIISENKNNFENSKKQKESKVKNIENNKKQVLCDCQKQAKEMETKTGVNAGRMFYTCNFFPKKCSYFCWADQNVQSLGSGTVNCFCNYEAHKKTAQTNENSGREFWCCKKSYKKCKFFQWVDE